LLKIAYRSDENDPKEYKAVQNIRMIFLNHSGKVKRTEGELNGHQKKGK
jgi:hypothetical protein